MIYIITWGLIMAVAIGSFLMGIASNRKRFEERVKNLEHDYEVIKNHLEIR